MTQPYYGRHEQPQQKKRKKKSTGRRTALIVLIVLAVLALAAVLVYRHFVVKPEIPTADHPQVSVPPEMEGTLQDKVDGARKSASIYTILVVGTDTSSNSTDTMMLVTYDVTNQSATVMSIPRDTLVNAFGTSRYTRLNSVYTAYGGGEEGMAALTYEVSELVGFVPDFQMFIQWELVGLMVDAMGGVEYDVPYHMEYDDPAQDLHIYIEKGLQTLDGDHAMQLVRWRKNNPGVASGGGTGSDLNRLKVQQGFLKAVLKQLLQLKNVTRINELARLLSDNITGNLTLENLCWFGFQAVFGGLAADDVEFLTMPVLAANPYVYPDQSQLLELINTKLNPYQKGVTLDQLDLIYFDANGTMRSTGK